MTVASETNRSGPYSGNGVTTVFSYGFRVLDEDHIRVIKTSALGVETVLTIATHYTVSGVGNPAGGSVTLLSAPATGETVTLLRAVPFVQETDLENQGAYYAETVEAALDLAAMRDQQLAEELDRALRIPASSSAVDLQLPTPEARKIISWNEAADGLQNLSPAELSSVVAYGTANSDIFTGDGVTTVFSLSANPAALNNLDVAIGGVTQLPGVDYNWSSGTNITFTTAPANGVKVLVRYMQALAQGSSDGAATSFSAAGIGAVERTVEERLRETISAKDFGAAGDGVADDTAAITAADTYARSIGAELRFPAGTYMVSQLVIHTNSNWVGEGRDSTTIKQIAGSNTDLIYGYNSNANWGSSNPDDFVVGWSIRDLTIDGNRAGNTSGSGVAVYGPRPIMENVFIKNCAEYGLRTEYTDDAFGGLDTWAMEGWFSNIRIDTTGKDGWLNNGPHDSVDINVIVIDAGQSAANTYDGVYFGPKSNGRHFGMHCWTRSWSVRARTGIYIEDGTSGHDFSSCHFEGGYVANVILKGTSNLFDDTCRFYAAWNGINMLLTGPNCTLNTIKGRFLEQGPGRPNCIGIKLGSVPGDYVTGNVIDVNMSGQEGQNFAFDVNNTGQDNVIRAKCFNTTSATVTGTPPVSDDIDIVIRNSGGKVRICNKLQRKTISIGASTTATWTFDYPFAASPIVNFSPDSPAGLLTSGIWIASRGSTSVTFYNNNSVALTLDATAVAVA